MKTPFLGSAYVSRSKNLADQECINLYTEIVETKSGKDIGALYMTPGLDLLAAVGPGPIRGTHPMGSQLYVVSGNSVYSVDTSFVATLLGTVSSQAGQVSMIDNGTQCAFFDGTNGYMIGPSYSLASATLGNSGGSLGTSYAPGDVLTIGGGTFTTAARLTIATTQAVNAGVWLIVSGGAGGAPGAVTLTGTTGTGTKFQIAGTISAGGVLTALGAITVIGSYTVNPTNLNAEPVTGGGLVGATVSVVMGAATATVSKAGTYSTKPSSPIAQSSTTGLGTGATWAPVWTTTNNALLTLSLPFSNPVSASYQDGFGLVNSAGTQQFYQSNLKDLSTWQALNFSSADGMPTSVVAISEVHREQWLFKTDTVEIWIDAGNAGFAFQRLDGVFLEVGCAAPFSVCVAAESLMWLTQNLQGEAQIVKANGYSPVRVSTHCIEREIASYTTISDAVAFSYQQEGHIFYVISFPSADVTWAYDLTASSQIGFPMWHRRASFAGGQFHRHLANTFALFSGKPVAGDYSSGNLYALNLDTKTDNGAQRKWLRSWRAMQKSTTEPVRFSSLTIDMQTGMGVPDGTAPSCMLRFSDDGGHNWSDLRTASVGQTGKTARRVKFNRLGSTRKNSGLDRIFELSSTDAFSVALIGADLQ